MADVVSRGLTTPDPASAGSYKILLLCLRKEDDRDRGQEAEGERA